MSEEEGEGKSLVNWEERMAQDAKDAASVERPSISSISLRGGIMSYMDTEVPGNKIPCVVLSSVIKQSYYDQPYDANNIIPPTCFALGKPGEEEFMAPHKDVPPAQRGHGVACNSCEFFQWGSGRGKGKACGTRRRLALIPTTALETDEDLDKAEIAVLKVPVTSVRNWSSYVNGVSAEHARPTWGVITEISLKPDAKTTFKVLFSALGLIEVSRLPRLQPLIERAQNILHTPFDMAVSSDVSEPEDPKGKKKY